MLCEVSPPCDGLLMCACWGSCMSDFEHMRGSKLAEHTDSGSTSPSIHPTRLISRSDKRHDVPISCSCLVLCQPIVINRLYHTCCTARNRGFAQVTTYGTDMLDVPALDKPITTMRSYSPGPLKKGLPMVMLALQSMLHSMHTFTRPVMLKRQACPTYRAPMEAASLALCAALTGSSGLQAER